MQKQKPAAAQFTKGQTVRYWDQKKGGWYHGLFIKAGYKWATIQDYWPGQIHRTRVPLTEVREVAQ